MGRKKVKNRDQLYACSIRTRVTADVLKRLENIVANGDCRSVGEAARRILCNIPITIYHKDITLQTTIHELAGIKKELKAIGVNINQVTRHFHLVKDVNHRVMDALRVGELYKQAEEKIDRLIVMMENLAAVWLQKSSSEKA